MNLLWYTHGFSFGGVEKEISFGRYLASGGEEQFVAQSAATLNSANSGPRVGPVVINEIMYHPPEVFLNGKHWDNDEDEYIELHNITAQPVPLFDPAHPANAWSLRGVVDFDFPTNRVVPAQGFLVVVGFDPAAKPIQAAAFRAKYGVDSSLSILGPYTGKLDNSVGSVRLFKPGEPETALPDSEAEVPRILTDAVDYGDDSPWPLAADGSSIRCSGPRVFSTATIRPIGPVRRQLPERPINSRRLR